jgi:hypothetical protein
MTRHAWLALAKHLRKLAHRQFHQSQERYDAKARRICQRLESIGKRKHRGHEIRI